MDEAAKMSLTAEQFLYLAIIAASVITIAFITLFVCLRSQPNVLLALFADALFLRMLTVVVIIAVTFHGSSSNGMKLTESHSFLCG
jgi:hypothetical protein